jgi:glycosyltransferase involved in cell wall biosynthesis
MIRAADNHFLKRNVTKVFAQSRNVQRQLQQWGEIPSEVLYPPPPENGYFTAKYGDFIFSPARLTPLKRIPLLLESLAKTGAGNAVLAGDGPEKNRILEWIQQHSLEKRVHLIGHVSQEELKTLYAECRAVYYSPVNEDFGLVTMEAFRSRKPVITTVDSGGPAEIVHHENSGFVVAPQPDAIARCITNLFEDENLAEKLGETGYQDWKHVTWPETMKKLLLI